MWKLNHTGRMWSILFLNITTCIYFLTNISCVCRMRVSWLCNHSPVHWLSCDSPETSSMNLQHYLIKMLPVWQLIVMTFGQWWQYTGRKGGKVRQNTPLNCNLTSPSPSQRSGAELCLQATALQVRPPVHHQYHTLHHVLMHCTNGTSLFNYKYNKVSSKSWQKSDICWMYLIFYVTGLLLKTFGTKIHKFPDFITIKCFS